MIGTTLAGLALAASVPAQSGCPIERAAYAMRGGARLTASFRDVGTHAGWPGRLAFGVRSARTNRTFWFLFDRGAARRINLISTEDVSRPGPAAGPLTGRIRSGRERRIIAMARDRLSILNPKV